MMNTEDHASNGCFWLIPDCDQAYSFFIKTAAPLMGRNATVGVKVAL